jgi:hypothetical protein
MDVSRRRRINMRARSSCSWVTKFQRLFFTKLTNTRTGSRAFTVVARTGAPSQFKKLASEPPSQLALTACSKSTSKCLQFPRFSVLMSRNSGTFSFPTFSS